MTNEEFDALRIERNEIAANAKKGVKRGNYTSLLKLIEEKFGKKIADRYENIRFEINRHYNKQYLEGYLEEKFDITERSLCSL